MFIQNFAHWEFSQSEMHFIKHKDVPTAVIYILADFLALQVIAEHLRSLFYKIGYNGVCAPL